MTWRSFVKHYSAEQLEKRFAYEEECLARGESIRSRAFFASLKELLKEEDS